MLYQEWETCAPGVTELEQTQETGLYCLGLNAFAHLHLKEQVQFDIYWPESYD